MIEQESRGERLVKLRITGDRDELVALAMTLMDAVDDGKAKTKLAEAKIVVRCDG